MFFVATAPLSEQGHVNVTRVGDSCGYGVPLMSFEGLREHHELSTAKKIRVLGQDGYAQHLRERNPQSIDGLPVFGVTQDSIGADR